MRPFLLTVLVVSPCIAFAAVKKPKSAVRALPVSPSRSSGSVKRSGGLIDSDLGGRDLAFLANALEAEKALRFLATRAKRTENPGLRGFGERLLKTLAAQSAALGVVAEARKIRIADGPSDTERRIALKIADLEGIRLEQGLLDQFREVERRALATYEFGFASNDPTIRTLCEQTLPRLREQLTLVETMAGIAPKPADGTTVTFRKTAPLVAAERELPPLAEAPLRLDFRANVRQSAESSLAAER
jgi:hypothetical protein